MDKPFAPRSDAATSNRTLVVENVRPWGGAPTDLYIVDGVFSATRPAGTGHAAQGTPGTGDAARASQAGSGAAASAATVVDGRGLLALPGFINAHAHVDKSWWGQPWEAYGGEATTQGRIAHERSERARLGIPGIEPTEAVLREFLRHGTTATRTHVDVDLGVGLDGIAAVRQAAANLSGAVDVQIIAFPQDGVMRRPGVLDLLDRAGAEGADYIGGLDPCAIDRDPVGQLDGIFAIADRHGCGLDIHLHSPAELGAFEYELIIERTRALGLQGRVNVSHGFGLGDLPAARQQSLVEQFGELGISWSTVAPVKAAPLPWRDMAAHEVPIGLGTDGIRDLWSPYGDGDILRVAWEFARIHGVRYDEDFTEVARLAGSGAARFVGREVHDLVPGAVGDLVLIDAENVPDALVRVPRRELVVAGGRIVAEAGEPLI